MSVLVHEHLLPIDELAQHAERPIEVASGTATVEPSIRMKLDEAGRLAAGAREARACAMRLPSGPHYQLHRAVGW